MSLSPGAQAAAAEPASDQRKARFRRIFHDVSWLSGGHLLSFGLVIAQGFIAARSLGPVLFGAWSICQLVLYYSMYLHMGTAHALVRELPTLLHSDGRRAKQLLHASFTITLLALALGAGVVFFARHTIAGSVPDLDGALAITACALVLQGLFQFAMFYFRGSSRFPAIAKSTLSMNTLAFIAMAVLIPRWGLRGAAWSWLITYSILFVILWRPAHAGCGFNTKTDDWKHVFRVGAPVFATDIIFAVVWTLDRVAIATMRSPIELGYYSVAAVFLRLLLLVPDLFQQGLYPHWARWRTCLHSEPGDGAVLVVAPTILLSWAMPFLQGGAFLLIPAAITLALPKYVASIRIAQILVIGIGFMSIGQFLNFFLTAMNAGKVSTRIQVVLLVVRAVCLVAVLYSGLGLVSVAVVNLLANAAYALATTRAVHRVQPQVRIPLQHVMLPWMVTVALVVGIDFWRQHCLLTTGIVWSTTAAALLFTAVAAVLVWIAAGTGLLPIRALRAAMNSAS